eukprot:Colp12_sorted_trinity150504_noHs@33918
MDSNRETSPERSQPVSDVDTADEVSTAMSSATSSATSSPRRRTNKRKKRARQLTHEAQRVRTAVRNVVELKEAKLNALLLRKRNHAPNTKKSYEQYGAKDFECLP